MEMRPLIVCVVILLAGVSVPIWHPPLAAQSCNVSPDRPLSATAARASDGSVLIAWSHAGGCAPTKFYVEASRGTTDLVEQEITDASDRSASLALGANNGTPWRIAVRAHNASGLSLARVTVLTEGTVQQPANPCATTFAAPTLLAANAVGRTLTVQWAASPCLVTGYSIIGQTDPNGPIVGAIDIPYPTTAWTGQVPPGAYYVRVAGRYYQRTGQASNAIFIQVP